MQLGTIHLWGEREQDFRAEIELAAGNGFDLIGIGDSPAGWHDLGISMAVAAAAAPGRVIAPMVTSPFMRHPLVTASMMSTLHDLTDGKAALGFATGGSTVLAIGRPPANQTEIRAHIAALRALFAGEAIEWDGLPVKPLRFPRPVPLMYSAFGPKAIQLAGEQADGAILFTGDRQIGELRHKIDAVRAAAQAAGRDPMSVKIWAVSYTAVRETRKRALEDLKAFVVVNGMAIMFNPALAEQVPTQFKGKMQALLTRYDPSEHVVVGGRNVTLMEELGLSEFLGDFDTTVGTPAEVKASLDEIAALGVDAFFIPLPGHSDPAPTIRAVAEMAGSWPGPK